MPIKQTPYGTVDAKAFKRLRGSFETMKVLYALDTIDEMRGDIARSDSRCSCSRTTHSGIEGQ